MGVAGAAAGGVVVTAATGAEVGTGTGTITFSGTFAVGSAGWSPGDCKNFVGVSRGLTLYLSSALWPNNDMSATLQQRQAKWQEQKGPGC